MRLYGAIDGWLFSPSPRRLGSVRQGINKSESVRHQYDLGWTMRPEQIERGAAQDGDDGACEHIPTESGEEKMNIRPIGPAINGAKGCGEVFLLAGRKTIAISSLAIEVVEDRKHVCRGCKTEHPFASARRMLYRVLASYTRVFSLHYPKYPS